MLYVYKEYILWLVLSNIGAGILYYLFLRVILGVVVGFDSGEYNAESQPAQFFDTITVFMVGIDQGGWCGYNPANLSLWSLSKVSIIYELGL